MQLYFVNKLLKPKDIKAPVQKDTFVLFFVYRYFNKTKSNQNSFFLIILPVQYWSSTLEPRQSCVQEKKISGNLVKFFSLIALFSIFLCVVTTYYIESHVLQLNSFSSFLLT